MRLTLATWNINSVRLRLPLLGRLLAERQPDLICLQETKCPDDKFPVREVVGMGYPYVALNGQKGWHGVAVLSKLPFETIERRAFCDKNDCRHLSVTLGRTAGLADPLTIHDFYVPAGGEEPDPAVNPKFAHKLAFLDQAAGCGRLAAQGRAGRTILVGDLNVAPLEHDVWSHRQLLGVVSHTPVEVEKFTAWQSAGAWVDVMRRQVPAADKLFTWWSYRATDWAASNRGRRLDHVWASAPVAGGFQGMEVLACARSWDKPSDHAPVLATFEL
ncbi:exodeoxyribonuclease III [Blastochloris viridis]|uniref:Exodeoxyribonuclease III n=1 Tax=Blastochloris viridis TaxID=1079 RepID=A0A0H5BP63_BLAVI|nr:exodeoxyribonuclease III [Blastochloris viridis]ALK07933.1 Exodeoxyribonuclease III [Blastochloris viridis]BAR98813.1 exodeoxyribonuclease III [Blastochloris viridis]CUU43855.1 Exodeoxyribonuclease III [Blastochloris viridis]